MAPLFGWRTEGCGLSSKYTLTDIPLVLDRNNVAIIPDARAERRAHQSIDVQALAKCTFARARASTLL
jgi:hypothetical protein